MPRYLPKCTVCGKRTKNGRGWYYSPVFCSTACSERYHQLHLEKLKNDPKYKKEWDRTSFWGALYLFFVLGACMFSVLWIIYEVLT